MKMSKPKGKQFTVISDNPKMDTTGMAGKPMDYSDMMVEYKPPPMSLRQMMGKCKETQPKK
jgi:hypothetical protein